MCKFIEGDGEDTEGGSLKEMWRNTEGDVKEHRRRYRGTLKEMRSYIEGAVDKH